MPHEKKTYRRADLYEEVWTQPMLTVAKRYGVSSVALAKTCKKLEVPVPGRGYWARRRVGQNPKRLPLRKASAGVPDELVIRHSICAPPPEPAARVRISRPRERRDRRDVNTGIAGVNAGIADVNTEIAGLNTGLGIANETLT